MYEPQHHPGRTIFCCTCMKWALSLGYIRQGYFFRRPTPPVWICWTLELSGKGWKETSPIHFCPFCGVDLDAPED